MCWNADIYKKRDIIAYRKAAAKRVIMTAEFVAKFVLASLAIIAVFTSAMFAALILLTHFQR